MQKDRLQKDFHIRKSLVPILFTMFTLFYFSGCLTDPALKLAEKKAEDTINYKNIKNIITAIKQENDDILVCFESADIDDIATNWRLKSRSTKESECHTIALPISSLAKGAVDKNVHGFKDITEAGDIFFPLEFYSYPASWKFYLYPIEKAQKGCNIIYSEKFSTAESLLPIEEVNVSETAFLSDSFDTYNKLVKKLSKEEKIYAVRLGSAEQDTAMSSNGQELINQRAEEPIRIHLIYWPSQTMREQEGINPIGIAGGYQFEHKGNNWWYLLVPPAFVVDLFLFAASGVH